MIKKLVLFLFVGLLCMGGLTSCERIDAGNEGILVNLYGDDRGVDQVSMCTGWVWYNPVTQQVYEYPTFVQQIDYPSFKMNAKDGSEFTLDPTVSLKIKTGKSPYVFKRYRKELKDVINGPLSTYIMDCYRIEINKFTTDQIVSNREAVEDAVENRIRKVFNNEGFDLIQITSGLKYPQVIVQSVDAKNKAIQDAQRAENEVKVAQAEAQKQIVKAKADAEAQSLRTQSLTPAILRKAWIDKWDGKLPVYGNVPNLMKMSE